MAAAETPLHPSDLTQHLCIGWRSSADVAPYRWEFSKEVRELAVAVDQEVTTDGIDLMVGMALAGACLTVGMEETFAPRLENSRLRTGFDPFCPSLPGLSCFTQTGVISHQAAGDGQPCKGLTQTLSPLSHVDGLILGIFLVLNQRNCFLVSLLSRYPSVANVHSSEAGQSRPSLWNVASSHFWTSMRRR
jgi:hypothetical protein